MGPSLAPRARDMGCSCEEAKEKGRVLRPALCPVVVPVLKPGSDLRELALGDGLRGRGVAQHVAATPDRLDVVVAAGRLAQLLAELADEDVDDLELGLVHAAVEMIEEHLLGERGALAQAQKLEDAVF